MQVHKLFLGYLSIVLLALSGLAAGKPAIILDPGHGGKDPGGHYGRYYEKYYALDTSLRVEKELRRLGYRVVLTRRRDTFLSLGQRTRLANRYGRNALFVSIHYNAHRNRSARGLETFYASGSGRLLARSIQYSMNRRVSMPSRGARKANYYVLRNTSMPAVLVEGGFLTNSRDRSQIRSSSYRSKIATGIAEGVHRYVLHR